MYLVSVLVSFLAKVLLNSGQTSSTMEQFLGPMMDTGSSMMVRWDKVSNRWHVLFTRFQMKTLQSCLALHSLANFINNFKVTAHDCSKLGLLENLCTICRHTQGYQYSTMTIIIMALSMKGKFNIYSLHNSEHKWHSITACIHNAECILLNVVILRVNMLSVMAPSLQLTVPQYLLQP